MTGSCEFSWASKCSAQHRVPRYRLVKVTIYDNQYDTFKYMANVRVTVVHPFLVGEVRLPCCGFSKPPKI